MDNTLRKMRKELTNLCENVVKDHDKARIVQDVLRSYNRLSDFLRTLEKSQPVFVYRLRVDNHIDKYSLVSTDNRGRYLSRTDADGRQRFFVDMKGVSSTDGDIPLPINGELADKVIRKDKPLEEIYKMVDKGYRLTSFYFEDKEMLQAAMLYDNRIFVGLKRNELDNQIKFIKESEERVLRQLENL